MNKTPTVLCILDGLGLNPDSEANAVAMASTPVLDSLFERCPHATLTTHGSRVGLPEGQMGNSEVGHLNIGAGRVVDQWLVRINKALATDDIEELPALKKFIDTNQKAPRLHLCGLYSDGGVHSHLLHLGRLIEILSPHFNGEICLHLFTDGRDTAPESGITFVKMLEDQVKAKTNVSIASIQGRFYAMDRDSRWKRTQRAYDCLTKGSDNKASAASTWLRISYEQDITDEFVEPASITDSLMRKGDAVLFWNFRADRMRQLVRALCLPDSELEREQVIFEPDQVLCFTPYDESFGLPVLFEPLEINNYLGQVLSQAGLSQLRVAETEKYPHVTYFLNGGKEESSPGESRSLVPSPREVKTYDQKPEMSAFEVRDIVVHAIETRSQDVIIVNFANCDMVGHSGSLPATIKAVETVDSCLGDICEALEAANGQMLVIADHGNAEMMRDKVSGEPHTAHTNFPVPIILVGNSDFSLQDGGALCDVAPTILQLLALDQPAEMSGTSLLVG